MTVISVHNIIIVSNRSLTIRVRRVRRLFCMKIAISRRITITTGATGACIKFCLNIGKNATFESIQSAFEDVSPSCCVTGSNVLKKTVGYPLKIIVSWVSKQTMPLFTLIRNEIEYDRRLKLPEK